MTATVPSGIVPLLEGYACAAPLGADVSTISGGTGSKAQEFERGMQLFTITLILTKLEFFVWMCFFHHIIKQGAISFLMPLDSGLGTTNHLCNIIPDTHSAQRTGYEKWSVTFTVEAEANIYA